MATFRENPGLRVKLLVGPTCKIPQSTQRSCWGIRQIPKMCHDYGRKLTPPPQNLTFSWWQRKTIACSNWEGNFSGAFAVNRFFVSKKQRIPACTTKSCKRRANASWFTRKQKVSVRFLAPMNRPSESRLVRAFGDFIFQGNDFW